MPTLLRSRRFIRAAAQVLFVGTVVAVLVGAALTAQANLQKQGLTSGFSFLWNAAGWDLTFASLPTNTGDPYWWYLLVGLANTVLLGTVGLFLATVIGGGVGLARLSHNAPTRLLGTLYVEIFRNIPLIVQAFFWYALASRLPPPRSAIRIGDWLVLSGRGVYVAGLNVNAASGAGSVGIAIVTAVLLLWWGSAPRFRRVDPTRKRQVRAIGLLIGAAAIAATLAVGRNPDGPLLSLPILEGLNFQGGLYIPPEFYAMAVSIAAFGGAYIGEIVRGGFLAVGRGQSEAAMSLGLTPWQCFARIQFPLALRAMLPILTNQYVWLMKATTLGIAVGFADFFMVVAGVITHSGQTLELIGILMAGFLTINLSLSGVMNRINKAIALKGNQLRS